MKTNRLIPDFSLRCPVWALAFVVTFFLGVSHTHAASATWNVDGNGSWVTNANWSPGAAPGLSSGNTSTDTATFGATLTATRNVTVDTTRNIKTIVFDHASTGGANYTLVTGGSLRMSPGGLIESVSATGSSSDIDRIMTTTYVDPGSSFTIRNTGQRSLQMTYVRGNGTVYLDGNSTSANNLIGGFNGTGTGGSLVKNGTGYWKLNNTNNSMPAGVTINAGIFELGNNIAIPSGTSLTMNGGTLQFGLDNMTISPTMTVGGDFAFASGTSAPSFGNATFSGSVDLGGATRVISVVASSTSGGGGYDPRVFVSGVISNGGLTKAGAGYMVFTGNNTYTGTTTINDGYLVLGNNGTSGSLGSGAVVTTTGTALVINRSNALTLNNNISGTGDLAQIGPGATTLTGNNTYTGDTTVSDGSLILSDTSRLNFLIQGNGINNAIVGTSTLLMNGTFSFDLTGADTTYGNSWDIVSMGTLAASYGSSFSVEGFTYGSGNWTYLNGGKTWTYQESTGVLNVIPEPSVVALVTLTCGGLLFGLRRRRVRRA